MAVRLTVGDHRLICLSRVASDLPLKVPIS